MAASLLARIIAGSTNANDATTPAVDTTGADFLVVAVASANNGVVVTDSKFNTWTPLTGQTTGNAAVQLFYCVPPANKVGTGHTFTATLTAAAPSIAVQAWKHLATSPFDQESGALQNFSASSIQPGNLLPSADEALIIIGEAGGTSRLQIDGAFVLTDDIVLVGGQHYPCGMGFALQATRTAVNPTITFSVAAGTSAVALAAFFTSPTTPVTFLRAGIVGG